MSVSTSDITGAFAGRCLSVRFLGFELLEQREMSHCNVQRAAGVRLETLSGGEGRQLGAVLGPEHHAQAVLGPAAGAAGVHRQQLLGPCASSPVLVPEASYGTDSSALDWVWTEF